MVNGKIQFENEIKNNSEIRTYDLDGSHQDSFDRKAFDINGFNLHGSDENGNIRSEEKFIQAIRENPWNIYYVSEVFRNKYEFMKQCDKPDPNTYQCATLNLK